LSQCIKGILTGISLFTVISSIASANTGEIYGFGSRASGLGNTMLGGIKGGYGTYYNPATNSLLPGLNASLGIAYAKPKFLDIKSVTIANNATTADPGDVIGDVDTDYLDYLTQSVGATFNFGERWKNLTVGATASMPIARVAYLDTGEPFLPEYFNYRSRTQRPQIFASMSVQALRKLHLATGLAIATNLSGSTRLVAGTPGNGLSYQRFASTIKPSVSPYFALYTDPANYQLGAVLRMPSRAKIDIDTVANARFLGSTGGIPMSLNSASSLYYDPLELDLAFGWNISNKDWLTVEGDWLQYAAFESPSLTVKRSGGITLTESISNLPEMQNIIIFKTGYEHHFEKITGRAGFYYRPSPVKNNSGPGNLVDPAQAVFTLGAGIDLKKAGTTDHSITVDFHAQYHRLITKHITKTPGNEVGTAGQTKIGSPGYDIGGNIYGGGVSISMAF